MPDEKRRPVPVSASRKTEASRLYLAVGGMVVALLIGMYVAIGTPGLHTQIASAPVPASSEP
jgi:hypothetical protein